MTQATHILSINSAQPIGEIASGFPGAISLFEDRNMDYYRGGRWNLKDACDLAGVSVEEMVVELEKLRTERFPLSVDNIDWRERSTGELIDYILVRHHVFTRAQLDRLKVLSEKVLQTEGTRHPELFNLDNLIHDMSEELEGHLAQEEEVVFSYLKKVELARREGKTPRNPYSGSPIDQHPLRVLMWEHGMTGEEWREISRLTHHFTTPADASEDYKALTRALRELEQDLHRHLHLENNVLFPRAIQMGLFD
jgi:regulator of cell morphogenesis and NO signaling